MIYTKYNTNYHTVQHDELQYSILVLVSYAMSTLGQVSHCKLVPSTFFRRTTRLFESIISTLRTLRLETCNLQLVAGQTKVERW
jgi:hypothetical protein